MTTGKRCDALAGRVSCVVAAKQREFNQRHPQVNGVLADLRAGAREPFDPRGIVLPGSDPIADARMRDTLAAVKGGEGFGYAGDLPIVGVEVGGNRFGGEERSPATSALNELLQPRFC
jgi:hypothetical protein